jgi:uncharacterized protein with FMN-binding domain
MRRIVITTVSTVAGVLALLGLKPDTADLTSSAGAPATSSPGGSSSTVTSGAAPRTVTGDAINTRFGPVQVQVTLADGRITDVQVLQYPNSDRRDAEINGYALPLLVQATLDANSADIDMVSGATYTSDGYVRSLQSALDQAGW